MILILSFIFNLFACETIDCNGEKHEYSCNNFSTLLDNPSLCSQEEYCQKFKCDNFNPKNVKMIAEVKASDFQKQNQETLRSMAIAHIGQYYKEAITFNQGYNDINVQTCSLSKIYQKPNCQENLKILNLDKSNLDKEFQLMDQGYYEPKKANCFDFKAQLQMKTELDELVKFSEIKLAFDQQKVSKEAVDKFKSGQMSFLEFLNSSRSLKKIKMYFEDSSKRLSSISSSINYAELESILTSLEKGFEYPASFKSKLYSNFQDSCTKKLDEIESSLCSKDLTKDFVINDVKIFNKGIQDNEQQLGYQYYYCDKMKTSKNQVNLHPNLSSNTSYPTYKEFKNGFMQIFDDKVDSICPIMAGCNDASCIQKRCEDPKNNENPICMNISAPSGKYTMKYLESALSELKSPNQNNLKVARSLMGEQNSNHNSPITIPNKNLAQNNQPNHSNQVASNFTINPNQSSNDLIVQKKNPNQIKENKNQDTEDDRMQIQKENLNQAISQFEKEFNERNKRLQKDKNNSVSNQNNKQIEKNPEQQEDNTEVSDSNSAKTNNSSQGPKVVNNVINNIKDDKTDMNKMNEVNPTNQGTTLSTGNLNSPNTKELKEAYKNNISILEDKVAGNLKVEIKVSHFNINDIDTLIMAIEEQLGDKLKAGRIVEVAFVDQDNRKINLKMEPLLNRGTLEYKVSVGEGNRSRDEEVAKAFANKLNKKISFDLSKINQSKNVQQHSKL